MPGGFTVVLFFATWFACGYLGWTWANFHWQQLPGRFTADLRVVSLLVGLLAGPLAVLASAIQTRDFPPGRRLGLKFW